MTGPDWTTSGRRYSPHDLLAQLINLSKVITEDGRRVHNGVIQSWV